MFTLRQETEDRELEKAIAYLYAFMDEYPADSEEYKSAVAHLTELKKIQKNQEDRISKDTMVSAGTNLLGILLVINHERLHVIATRALGFIAKTRVS